LKKKARTKNKTTRTIGIKTSTPMTVKAILFRYFQSSSMQPYSQAIGRWATGHDKKHVARTKELDHTDLLIETRFSVAMNR
jgi:hypothetical protein